MAIICIGDHCQVLTALACGATVDSAAHSAGMSARTVHRRLQEPAFLERLQQVRTDMIGRTAAMLTAAGLESVKTLLTMTLKLDALAAKCKVRHGS